MCACSRMHTGSLTCTALRTARAHVREPAHASVRARGPNRAVPHTLARARGDDRIFLRGGEIAHLRAQMQCHAVQRRARRCAPACDAQRTTTTHHRRRRSMQPAKRSTRVRVLTCAVDTRRRRSAGAPHEHDDARTRTHAHGRTHAHACHWPEGHAAAGRMGSTRWCPAGKTLNPKP